MAENKRIQVAIDGPAGAGKSTVAREVANRLGLKYLDTGAMYRAITLKVIRNNLNLEDINEVKKLLDDTVITLGDNKQVFLDGDDVTEEIRLAHVNNMVSPVSALSPVRRRLVSLQQKIAAEADGIIMEGRDIGSCVLPEANFKFYLTASVEERARRRCKEQLEKGVRLNQEEVMAEIVNRDKIDSERKDSPLTRVADAIDIDTTGMSFEEVVDRIIASIAADSS